MAAFHRRPGDETLDHSRAARRTTRWTTKKGRRAVPFLIVAAS